VTDATQTGTGLYVLTLESPGDGCAFVASSELAATFTSIARLPGSQVRIEVRNDAGVPTNSATNLIGAC
jgi:hypothetical protein